jgi:hypothetical protein
MVEDRARFGLLLSALGSALLGLAVFLPWYAVTITASGAAAAQQALASVAQAYGNAAFQAQASSLGAGFGAVAGRQVATLSAHQVLTYISAILLLLAGISLLAALLRLAGVAGPLEGGGGQIAVVGAAATLCVLFRMVERPGAQQDFFALSLSWGVWLALAGGVAIVVGGLWSSPAGLSRGGATQRWELQR